MPAISLILVPAFPIIRLLQTITRPIDISRTNLVRLHVLNLDLPVHMYHHPPTIRRTVLLQVNRGCCRALARIIDDSIRRSVVAALAHRRQGSRDAEGVLVLALQASFRAAHLDGTAVGTVLRRPRRVSSGARIMSGPELGSEHRSDENGLADEDGDKVFATRPDGCGRAVFLL